MAGNFKADKLSFSFLDSILILPAVLIKEQLQKPQMKAKVVKEREKTLLAAKQKPISEKGNSVLDIACFVILTVLKIPSLQECFHMKF